MKRKLGLLELIVSLAMAIVPIVLWVVIFWNDIRKDMFR
jgi:hypothetical protein